MFIYIHVKLRLIKKKIVTDLLPMKQDINKTKILKKKIISSNNIG
jgi:hypothetical protein